MPFLRHKTNVSLAIFTSIFVIGPAQSQSLFDEERSFIVQKHCTATRSIRKQSQPSKLEIGESYKARGLNKENGPTHVLIRVDDTSKWAALSCGRFADGQPPSNSVSLDDSDTRTCLPFFDNDPGTVRVGFGGTVDITPTPPSLSEFDRTVLQICGPAGKVVPRAEFRQLFLSHPRVLHRLMQFTGNKVYADRPAHRDKSTYLQDLTEAWYAIKGFDHIFCGEPNPRAQGGKVGGLHFHGRYLQLQRSGDLCRMNNLRQSEVYPGVIYTLGLRMKNQSGRFVPDARKGYGLTLDAEDIFKIVTRAFAQNPTDRKRSTGCLLDLTDDGHSFKAVFVRRKSGIRTFYPDATPRAKGDRKNSDCKSPIATPRPTAKQIAN